MIKEKEVEHAEISNWRPSCQFPLTSYYYRVSKVVQEPLYEDTSFNQDTFSCPKGVWNRGVPLY